MVKQYRKRPQEDDDEGAGKADARAEESQEPQEAQRHPREDRRERSRSRSPERERERERKLSPAVNQILRGRVTSVREFGCFVRLLEHDRDGLVHISQATGARVEVEELKELFPVGRSVWVKVVSISPDAKKVGLSTKLVDQTCGADLDPGHTGKATRESQQKGCDNATGRTVPAEGVSRFVEPIGKVPDLFSIHRAKVMSGTDFAIFVQLEETHWEAMVRAGRQLQIRSHHHHITITITITIIITIPITITIPIPIPIPGADCRSDRALLPSA